ncbi:MAG: hypothetical protein ACI9A0_002397, partial [Pseudoalteromonas tetraodonis]
KTIGVNLDFRHYGYLASTHSCISMTSNQYINN